MPEDRKFVRVYYDDLIRDYSDVWYSDDGLAAYIRLLSTADPMWPTPPEVPRSVRTKALALLRKVGLVIDRPNGRFSIKGLDAERTKRSDAARNAAAGRWGNAPRNAGASDKPMPTQSSPSQTKPSEPLPAHDPWDDPEHEALVWLAKHGCDIRPGNGYHRKLVTAVEVHGVNALIGMMDRLAAAGTKHGDVKGFLFGAIDALDARGRPSLGELDKQDRDEERESDFARRVARTRERTAELRAVLEDPPHAR